MRHILFALLCLVACRPPTAGEAPSTSADVSFAADTPPPLTDAPFPGLAPTAGAGRPARLLAPPCTACRPSAKFGPNFGRWHTGVDFAAKKCTPIRAVATGVVEFAGWHPRDPYKCFGRLVVVKHEGGYRSLYAHNEGLAVSAGETVQPGQTLAFMGTTGSTEDGRSCSTGVHSHFELRHTSASPSLNFTQISSWSFRDPCSVVDCAAASVGWNTAPQPSCGEAP